MFQCFDEPSVARLLERDNFISLIALIGQLKTQLLDFILLPNFKTSELILRWSLTQFIAPHESLLSDPLKFTQLKAFTLGMNGQGIGTSTLASYCNTLDALELSKDERDEVDSRVDQLWDAVDKHSGRKDICCAIISIYFRIENIYG